MIDVLKKRLESPQYLKENFNKYVEAFVMFYGEEYREEIINKFRNCLVIPYETPDDIRRELSTLLNSTVDEYSSEFSSKYNINIKSTSLFSFYSFDSIDYDLSFAYLKCLSGEYSDYDEKRTIKFLESFGIKVSHENFNEVLSSGLEQYKEMIDEYISYVNKLVELKNYYSTYIDYQKECENLSSEVEKKCYKEMLRDLESFIPEHIKDSYLKVLNGTDKYTDKNLVDQYVGTSFKFAASSNAFSLDNDLLLNDPDAKNWQIDSIIHERIRFFKGNGIDLGNNYQDYVNSPECRAIWPSYELVDKVNELHDVYHNKFNIEYYENLGHYKDMKAQIDALGLANKDTGFSAKVFTLGTICTFTTFKKDEEGMYYPHPLVVFNPNHMVDSADHSLVHELNHVFEMSILKQEGDKIDYTSGWDTFSEDISKLNEDYNPNEADTLHEDRDKRKYELFSEIINEILAQKISTILKDNDLLVFSEQDNFKNTYTTSYQYTYFLVKEFMDEFLSDIIISRHDGNIEHIINKVGKENFDALNDLFHEFYERFAGMKIYNVLDDFVNGRDTDDTRFHNSLRTRSHEIVSRMKEYSLSQPSL